MRRELGIRGETRGKRMLLKLVLYILPIKYVCLTVGTFCFTVSRILRRMSGEMKMRRVSLF